MNSFRWWVVEIEHVPDTVQEWEYVSLPLDIQYGLVGVANGNEEEWSHRRIEDRSNTYWSSTLHRPIDGPIWSQSTSTDLGRKRCWITCGDIFSFSEDKKNRQMGLLAGVPVTSNFCRFSFNRCFSLFIWIRSRKNFAAASSKNVVEMCSSLMAHITSTMLDFVPK